MQNVETLNALLPLQRSKISFEARTYNWQSQNPGGKRLALTLPQLQSLELSAFKQGDVSLKCPKLAEARFLLASSLRIKVEDASLAILVFAGRERAELVDSTTEDHLVTSSASCELSRCLIEGVGRMGHLQKLIYIAFPSECMPKSFPPSL